MHKINKKYEKKSMKKYVFEVPWGPDYPKKCGKNSSIEWNRRYNH